MAVLMPLTYHGSFLARAGRGRDRVRPLASKVRLSTSKYNRGCPIRKQHSAHVAHTRQSLCEPHAGPVVSKKGCHLVVRSLHELGI